jgi:hypothetical protein
MAMTDYPILPSTLPDWVLANNFQRGFHDGRLFLDREGAPPMSRRRFTSAPMVAQFSSIFSFNQMDIWDSFWDSELHGGVMPFWRKDPIYGGIPMTSDTDAWLTTPDFILITEVWWLCQFDKQPPSFSPQDSDWHFAASVNVLN